MKKNVTGVVNLVICDNRHLVTITQERYDELLGKENFLNCLESAGVDNWNGYSVAYSYYIRGER